MMETKNKQRKKVILYVQPSVCMLTYPIICVIAIHQESIAIHFFAVFHKNNNTKNKNSNSVPSIHPSNPYCLYILLLLFFIYFSCILSIRTQKFKTIQNIQHIECIVIYTTSPRPHKQHLLFSNNKL